MYGIINICLKDLVVAGYGEVIWNKVRTQANIDDSFKNYDNYKDDVTYDAVDVIVQILGIEKDMVWQYFGVYWVVWCMRTKYDSLFHTLGRTLEDFLANLDYLHSVYMKTMYPDMIVPSFRVERLPDGDTVLHYYSNRKGLQGIVVGIVRGVARIIFKTQIKMVLLGISEETQMGVKKSHCTFHIKYLKCNLPALETDGQIRKEDWMGIIDTDWKGNLETTDDFQDILHAVQVIEQNFKSPEKKQNDMGICPINGKISSNALVDNEIFCQAQPYHVLFDDDLFIRQTGNAIRIFCSYSTQPGVKFGDIFYLEHPEIDLSSRNIRKFQDMIFMIRLVKENVEESEDSSLSLRGQMLRLPKNNMFLFLGSPRVTSFLDLQEKGMRFSDIAAHDVTRDLILFNQQRIAEVELTRQLEQKQEELRTLMKELETEKAKTESVLYSMLPKQVANLLREGKQVHAGEYNEVTILFSDVVQFTDICSSCEPLQIVHLLNEMYTKFDKLTTIHDVYKVETIGDAYMVVGGIPMPTDLHATNICKFAQDQIKAVAGVMRPNCSDESIQMRKEGAFHFEFRGKIHIKGKGVMPTYFISDEICEPHSGKTSDKSTIYCSSDSSTRLIFEEENIAVQEKRSISPIQEISSISNLEQAVAVLDTQTEYERKYPRIHEKSSVCSIL